MLPAVAAVIVSLVATREWAPNATATAVSRLLDRAVRAAEAVAARVPGGSRPAVWVGAGAALTTGLVLEAASLELDLGGGAVLTAGRLVIVALSLPPLGWLLLSARSAWRAPAAGCVAGAIGCLLVIAARTGILLGDATLVPLVGLGYTLVGLGLLGLATAAIDVRARIGAAAAGLLLAATLTPVPYVITSARSMIDQSLVTSLAAAAALISIGLTLRRPAAPWTARMGRKAGTVPVGERPLSETVSELGPCRRRAGRSAPRARCSASPPPTRCSRSARWVGVLGRLDRQRLLDVVGGLVRLVRVGALGPLAAGRFCPTAPTTPCSARAQAHTRAGGLRAVEIVAAVALIALAGRRLEGCRRPRA